MIRYEWDRETVSDCGDVLDHDHRDKLAHYYDEMADNQRLVLVRDVWSKDGDLVDRGWAYVEGGELPEKFDDGVVETVPVPERFRKELRAASRC